MAREQSRAFSFSEVIMPVVDERLIAKAKALRKQGRTQEEIAVELGVTQGTISVILRQHGLGGKLVKTQKAEEKVMNLRTKLAITGLGVALLMLLAFLTPVDAMAQIA
jgi:predicted transcriptional regulator